MQAIPVPSTDKLLAATEGAVGWITINNPARRNALSIAVWRALPGILDVMAADAAVRVIVVRGAGEQAFAAGADISEFAEARRTPEQVVAYEDLSDLAMARLYDTAKPTIAMIRGFCMGGGLALALCCDLRIASDDAQFAIPAAKLGVGYRYGGIKKLIDRVGPSYAKEILFTARRFSAAEAHHMGLINGLVAVDELEATVRDYCATMAANAPLTIAAAKQTINELGKVGPPDLDRCEQVVRDCFESDDYVEGYTAFLEKRRAAFRGH